MRNISKKIAEHFSGETTNICNCWKVIRTDGIIFGFTDHDHDVVFESQHYESCSGFASTSAETSLGLNVNSEEIAGALRSDRISTSDIRANRYDGAKVEIYLVNWQNPDEHLLQRVCTIGEITEEEGLFRAELRGLSSYLDQTFGRIFSASCDADLGDKRCRFNLATAGFSTTGTVTTLVSNLEFSTFHISQFQRGWFTGGSITWHSGNNLNLKRGIANCRYDHEIAATAIALWTPMPEAIKVGDQFLMTAGCDKNFSTCRKKFSNHMNFQGFPHMPGQDIVLDYARRNHINDGGVLIP